MIKKAAGIGAIVVALMGAVWLSWPKPGFQMYMEQKIQGNDNLRDQVVKLVRLASARTDRFAKMRSQLTLTVDSQRIDNPSPGEAFGGAVKFGDLVTLSLGVSLEEKWGSFKADFKADHYVAAAQAALAERFGIKRYYLVVQAFEPWANSPVSGGHERYQLLSYLYPLQIRPSEIPYRDGAEADRLADLLARNLLESAVVESEDCTRILCYRDLSGSLESLDRTATGFEILLQGRRHPKCIGSADEEVCFMQSEQEFLEALKIDPNNDHAHFGLGLIEINRARALNNRSSAYEVGRHLIGGLDHLARATSSNKYIGTLTKSEAWRKLLQSSREFQGLGLTPDFIKSADGYRLARRAMVEGKYDRVLELVDSLQNVPEWLQGHVAALNTQAQLERTDDRSEALRILEKFEGQRLRIDESIWAAIYGRAAAEWAKGDPVWVEKSMSALRLAVDKAHDRASVLDAMATEGIGYASLGQAGQARKIAADVKGKLDAVKSEGPNYRSVWLSLGLLYAQIDDFEQAATAFANAIGFDRDYLQLVDADRQLVRFRQWAGYREWRLGVIPR